MDSVGAKKEPHVSPLSKLSNVDKAWIQLYLEVNLIHTLIFSPLRSGLDKEPKKS